MAIQTAAQAFAATGNTFTSADLALMNKWLTVKAKKKVLNQILKTGKVPMEVKVLRGIKNNSFNIKSAGFAKISPLLKTTALAGATALAYKGIKKAEKGALTAIKGQKESSKNLKDIQTKAIKKMRELPKDSEKRKRLKNVLTK